MSDYPLAVIWDLDGTLIDSAPDLTTALNVLLRENNRAALKTVAVRAMIGNGVGKLVERGFLATGKAVAVSSLPFLVDRFLRIYQIRATDKTTLYPGAHDALRRFQEANIRQAICTNKPEAVSRQILGDLSIAGYFDAVVGGDTTSSRKPDPLPLRDCLQALAVSGVDSLMIGDTAVDVATARAANVRIGIVTHGYARQPAKTLGADFLIENLSTLFADVTAGDWPRAAAR
jgi:phosphoglycolate phosphatase